MPNTNDSEARGINSNDAAVQSTNHGKYFWQFLQSFTKKRVYFYSLIFIFCIVNAIWVKIKMLSTIGVNYTEKLKKSRIA